MKNPLSILIIGGAVFLFSLIGAINVSAKNEVSTNNLRLDILTPKKVLILGEILTLRFRVTNEGQESTLFANCLDIPNSNLKILISKDGNQYRRYSNSIWQRSDRTFKPIILKAGATIENSANLIWNYVPNVVNLNEVAQESLISDYVFTSKGNYHIKARCHTHSANEIFEIESAPIKIRVKEPSGKDKKIWNLIKDSSTLSFFIQEGDIHFPLWENPIRFVEQIREIIKKYPDSVIAQQLRKSVEKFNQTQVARQKSCEKMEGCNSKAPQYDPIKLL